MNPNQDNNPFFVIFVAANATSQQRTFPDKKSAQVAADAWTAAPINGYHYAVVLPTGNI